MRRSFFMQFAMWLALLCASTTALARAGSVLCVSGSGHVEIEQAGDDCCKDAHAPASELAIADRCDCVDTPLIQSAARSGIGTERLMTTWTPRSDAFREMTDLLAPATASVRIGMSGDPPRASVAVSSLRTIVLLA